MPSRLRVPFGYAVALLVLSLARPSFGSSVFGLSVALAGEAIRLWASGHIEKTRHLATGGPYAHTRNPLYLGSLVIGLGVAVAAGSWWAAALVAAYFGGFYPSVMWEERNFLRQKFVEDYASWAAAVPLFFPRLAPAGPRASRFDWRRVRDNREWRTAVALPAAIGLLYARRMIPL